MASKLLFTDSTGRHYTTIAQARGKYVSIFENGTATWGVEATGGPTNGPHILLDISSSSNNCYMYPRLSRCQDGVWAPSVAGLMGFWLKIDDTKLTTGPHDFISLEDNGIRMCRLRMDNAGSFVCYREQGGTVLFTTAAGTLTPNAWNHIQFKWYLANSNGRVVLRINRVNVGDSGLMDTLDWGTSVTAIKMLNSIQGTGVGGNAKVRLANLFIFGQSTFADQVNGNDYLDGRMVGYRAVTANGNANQGTPTSGANYTNVDEVTPDDDTTKVTISTVGHREQYQVAALPAGVTPDAQQIVAYIKKDSAGGTSAIEATVRHSGADYDSSEQGIPLDSYGYIAHPMDVNPGTGAAWTETNANAAEYGLQKSA
jgi:hypothetical protein